MTEPPYSVDREWEEFRRKYPEFFDLMDDQPEHKSLHRVLDEHGPHMATVLAESMRTKEAAQRLLQRTNLLLGLCAGTLAVSLVVLWVTV